MPQRRTFLLATTSMLLAGPLAGLATAQRGSDLPRSPELSESTRLPDRRSVVIGDRFYSVGAANGLYPATGFHTTGEMGGFWTPPIKLLDGVWFALDSMWLGEQRPAETFTSGWGYTRIDYAATNGVRASRTDVAADGPRAGLIALTLDADRTTEVTLTLDAHSELMNAYPWGSTSPSQSDFNLRDAAGFSGGALVFREQGTPPVRNATPHDYSAVVGGRLPPEAHQLGPDFRGPQSPPVVCPADGDQPCDDSTFGKGTGGRLTYRVKVGQGVPTTLWFAVAGSDRSPDEARRDYDKVLADPQGLLERKIAKREALAANTEVELPGDPLLQQSVEWSKQNLADSAQESRDLRLRITRQGTQYPAPEGTLPTARWLGAGWPDYPWLFGTDGEYTAFAAVAAGRFDDIKAHLRTLKQVSDIVNDGSGKVIHEMTPDGSVYYGTNAAAGNTDETSKFPSTVALLWRWTGDNAFRDEMYEFCIRNLRYIQEELDTDEDGWPEGNGNVEREGMGPETLDNTVYLIRGYRDLADMARSKGDRGTEAWTSARAENLERRFERTWWFGGDTAQYADSLGEGTNDPVFQRHWIGLTPTDVQLVRPDQPTRPLASIEHGNAAITRRQQDCYSGEFGLYHTGSGPTSAEGGNRGPSCDSAVSSVQSERKAFTITTAIMAVSQGNYGRMAPEQQQRYTTANARVQLDPSVREMPGAMPEIVPSPDFGANIDRKFTERSMVLQAWGAYGVLWPVVHHQLGVSPDAGRNELTVVPQIPDGQQRIAGNGIRIGGGTIAVQAERDADTLRTVVDRTPDTGLSIGHVLPTGAQVRSVTLDGRQVDHRAVATARGQEVMVRADPGTGRSTLEIRLS